MTYVCKTATGSVYRIDMLSKTWERLEEGQDKSSNPLRTTHGYFAKCSLPTLGEGIRILAEPLTEGATMRLIYTSNVIEMEM